jgi:protein involved in sex pheromone biosynthesis
MITALMFDGNKQIWYSSIDMVIGILSGLVIGLILTSIYYKRKEAKGGQHGN